MKCSFVDDTMYHRIYSDTQCNFIDNDTMYHLSRQVHISNIFNAFLLYIEWMYADDTMYHLSTSITLIAHEIGDNERLVVCGDVDPCHWAPLVDKFHEQRNCTPKINRIFILGGKNYVKTYTKINIRFILHASTYIYEVYRVIHSHRRWHYVSLELDLHTNASIQYIYCI